MGRIGVILEVGNDTEGGEDIARVKVDLGGNDVRWAPLYGPPGNASKPVAGDYVALVGHPGGSGVTAVAFAAGDIETQSENGEQYIEGRDSDGAPVSVIHMKNDGTIRMENDNGYIELAPNGQVNINGNFTVDA